MLRRALRSALLVPVLTTALAVPALLPTAAPAAAAETGKAAVSEASKHRGKPYARGASGPSRFDCSGLTRYVYSKLGRSLPHNSAAQYDATKSQRVPNSDKRPGDLIFFRSGGRISHVALYAGDGKMWDAPGSGDRVRLRAIYSSSYVVTRPS